MDKNENDNNSYKKFLNVYVINNPIINIYEHYRKLSKFYEELNNTKLPNSTEFNTQIKNLKIKNQIQNLFSLTISGIILLKFKKISIINRIFFSLILYSGLSLFFQMKYYENLLDILISSKTHYGQEARILAKYFFPDHNKKLIIQNNIDEFRNYILKKKKLINEEKNILKDINEIENLLDDEFADQIEQELKKN